MAHKIFQFFCLLLFFEASQGQLLHKKQSFTHSDTLRGYLGPLRTGFDVVFYDLSVKVDPEKQEIEGSNKITFKALRNIQKIQLDLFANMKIRSIVWGIYSLNYEREENSVFVSFPKILKRDSIYTLDFGYYGKPLVAKNPPWDGGFTWSRDASGNPWVGVSCQGIGASLWWPNKDHQSDEPDSMVIRVSVPNKLKDISNGRLINTVDLGDGYTRFDWFVHNPINNYDVTLNIGNYVQFSENFQDLSCDYYVLPEDEGKARKQFTQVKTMLNTFINYFGPYPFKEDGYKLIESPYLGMEHQSAIAYGNHFKNGYLGTDLSQTGYGLSWDYIIVHESAHEWFGNSITSKDLGDMWIHESFASYAEGLFVEFNQGYAAGQAYLFGLRSNIQNDTPIIGPYNVNHEGSGDMYSKGANFLNTLRHIINRDSLWFSIIRKMNQVFYHRTIDGKELIDFFCRESHLDLHLVFDQYLKTTEIPKLVLKWTDAHTLTYKWTHCIKNFKMPVDLILENQKRIRIFPEENKWNSLNKLSQKDNPHIHGDNHSFYIDISSNPAN
jgi:aminopeptidase N